MRKVHLKVTLDVFIHADDDVDIAAPFNDGDLEFTVSSNSHLYPDDFGLGIIDVTVKNMEVMDSR